MKTKTIVVALATLLIGSLCFFSLEQIIFCEGKVNRNMVNYHSF